MLLNFMYKPMLSVTLLLIKNVTFRLLNGPAPRYTLRRNTANMMKIEFNLRHSSSILKTILHAKYALQDDMSRRKNGSRLIVG